MEFQGIVAFLVTVVALTLFLFFPHKLYKRVKANMMAKPIDDSDPAGIGDQWIDNKFVSVEEAALPPPAPPPEAKEEKPIPPEDMVLFLRSELQHAYAEIGSLTKELNGLKKDYYKEEESQQKQKSLDILKDKYSQKPTENLVENTLWMKKHMSVNNPILLVGIEEVRKRKEQGLFDGFSSNSDLAKKISLILDEDGVQSASQQHASPPPTSSPSAVPVAKKKARKAVKKPARKKKGSA